MKYGELPAKLVLENRYVLKRGGDVTSGNFNMMKAKGLLALNGSLGQCPYGVPQSDLEK